MDFSQMNIYKSKNKKRKLANEDDDEDNAEQKIKYNITTHGNEIYFYEDIYKEQILELINQIKNITFELEYISIKYNVKPVIHLHIYSNGGDAFMGLSIYDFIKKNKVPIYTFINGNIASAATFMYLAGAKRFMSETSTVLIHQISTAFWGKFEDLKDECKNTTELMKIVKDLYSNNTLMKKKQLDDILKRELFLNYEECKKLGFIIT
tara:strand:- start:2394 stop:3017 length:624 start_codon:yes stop_codon:yes gene_type:complete